MGCTSMPTLASTAALPLSVESLQLGQAGVQAVRVVAVGDGKQRGLRERETAPVPGVEAVVLLRRADGDDGVVAIVAAGEEDADQRLVAGAGVLAKALISPNLARAPMVPRAVTDLRESLRNSRLERMCIAVLQWSCGAVGEAAVPGI